MRKTWTALSTPLNTRRRVAQMRFTGYISVQLSGLLTPLLVFHLTHNASLAGLALLVEWMPKLGLYLLGGSLVECFSKRRAHMFLDIARLCAMLVFLFCALGHGSLWLVASAAAVYQCSNAVSNILFEVSVTRWWPEAERAHGHTTMMRCDLAACALALIYGLLTHDLLLLCAAGVVAQMASLLLVSRSAALVYPPVPPEQASAPHLSIAPQLKHDLKAATKSSLMKLALCAALMGVPAAMMGTAPVFYINRAQPGLPDMTMILSLVLLTKTFVLSLLLGWVQSLLRRGVSETLLASVGILLMVCCAALASLPLPLAPALIMLFGIASGSVLYAPWLRTRRQELVTHEVPDESRTGVTGVLISVEACAYLGSATVLSLSGNNLQICLLTACALALLGAYHTQIFTARVQPQEAQTATMSSQA